MAADQGVDISVSLRRKLNTLLDDIRDVRDQGKKVSSDPSQIFLFKGMFTTVDSLYERYYTIYNELCDLCEEDGTMVAVGSDHLARNNAKRYLHESHAYMLALPKEPQPSTSTLGNTTISYVGSRARAKLPTIALPTFSGTRTEWPRFRDLFESLVMGDEELRDVDRFHYLVASLKDPAASVIANLPINEDNFQVAWKSVKDIYDNKRLLASTYLDELLTAKALERKPPAKVLSERVAHLSKTVAAFRLLSIPDGMEFMLFHLACKGLDADTRIAFENYNNSQFPTFEGLIQFLRKRCDAAELASSITLASSNNKNQASSKPLAKPSVGGKSVLLLSQGSSGTNKGFTTRGKSTSHSASGYSSRSSNSEPSTITCIVCGDPHPLLNCPKFTRASVEDRHQMLSDWRGCRNCLYTTHRTSVCPSKFRCRFCKAKHHSLLCIVTSQSPNCPNQSLPRSKATEPSNTPHNSSNPQSSSSQPTSLNSTVSNQMDTLLGTAICCIGLSTPAQPIRLVIDSGSHLSFITRECANRVGLIIEPYHTDIRGIGETPLIGFKGQAKCTLSPQHSSYPKLSTSVIVVEKITAPLPGFNTPPEVWEPYREYDLADSEFWVSKPVDLLLGCDLFGDILTGQIITVKPDMPNLLGTIFGFVALGRLKDLTAATQICSLHAANQEPDTLDSDLQRFWALEEPPSFKRLNPDEEHCEAIFRDTHYRLPSGRYGVRLPFKSPSPTFAGTRAMSLRRLTHIESKLARNSLLKEKYHNFLQEYLDLGHMQPAPSPGKVIIPHHGVIKGEGEAMKIRVVFDAAARSSNGSLNDSLLVGPKLQTNIVVILLGFRIHQYVFTADAVKMYRQIEVHPEDRVYQHILWRFDASEPVLEYELNTLTYGMSCAPYEAIRTIHQLVKDEGDAFPLAARALLEDMYIDDIITGSASLEETLALLCEVTSLMQKGGFSLSKWAANHPDLLAACRDHDPGGTTITSEPVPLELDDDNSSVKILGLQWDSLADQLSYKITAPSIVCTKRAVLSAVAKIYDPLGYLSPTVVVAKSIVQEAWKHQLGWDDSFPSELQDKWKNLVVQLPTLAEIHVPRCVVPPNTTNLKLLIFADASEKAYCASAYLHVSTPNGNKINLILAKTKLAPVKTVTIPRLELCAALLAARLYQTLEPFCQRLPFVPQAHFFSDSMVVLAWLNTPSFKLKTFVANRVEQILELTQSATWHHVVSEENPSDLGSRGLLPSQLVNNTLWFSGPSWINRDPSEWPSSTGTSPLELPELKSIACALISTSTTLPPLMEWIQRFSSFPKLIHSFCFILRFLDRVRKTEKQIRSGPLTYSEIRQGTNRLIQVVQAHEFFNLPAVIRSTSDLRKLEIPKNLSSLQPFISEAGLLLVGGRLRHSDVAWSRMHPILLPAKSHFSRLVLEYNHRIYLHPGPTLQLAILRNKYWIPAARNAIRHISRSCVTCRKLKAEPCQPPMGDLPSSRFREVRPFLHVGIDFAGPFQVRESLRRKAPQFKAYLGIFVCLSTKALHLELVSDLSTAAFSAALNRFVGRRGRPEKIFTDNGTNFVGCANQLKEIYQWLRQETTQASLSAIAADKEITWSFNPPKAPFFGGVWEAGVKSVKKLLITVYGQNILTFEELTTLLIDIEAILNSRPLCPLSNDPCDISFLSPGHFLIGSPLLAVPGYSLVELPENVLSRWQLLCQKAQHFWKRWRTEYLTSLQERTKWKFPSYNLKVGDLVLIKDEQVPRLRWPIARVCEVHPGADNVVRVATVQTPNSTFQRPANKLIPLFLPTPSPPNHGDEESV